MSQWAEKHLTLSEKITQFSGRFSYDRTPYLREIVDNINDPKVDLVTFAKAAQVGGTQGLLSVGIAYAIDQDPGPAMIVFPSAVGGKEYSEERLQPMIDDCPRLRSHKLPDRDKFRKSTMYFDRMNLAIVGAGSPASLASRPVRYLFCDEIDKYKLNTNKEGNPLELADRRTRTFWNKKRFRISTPTVSDGPIWVSFLQGDQRRYWVPCPHCGAMQWLKFKPQLKWDEGCKRPDGTYDLAAVRASTYYECEHCQGKILDRHKPKMLRAGEWRPEVEGLTHRSYQLSALYPTWVSFGDVSTSFLEAKPYTDKLREFVTQTLGEPWEERGKTATVEEIMKHKEDYAEGYCPGKPYSVIVTADVQEDSMYYVIRAWGAFETSWLLRYGQVQNFEALQQVTYAVYQSHGGGNITVTHAFIDSGARTDEVYKFCQKYGWTAIKGRETENRSESYKWNVNKDAGVQMLFVMSDFYKDVLQVKLNMRNDEPGGWMLHKGTDYGYARHLMAESKVEEVDKKRGRPRKFWKRFDRQNHWLDCEVYQLAAAHALQIRFMQEPDVDLKPQESEDVKRRDGRGFWDR